MTKYSVAAVVLAATALPSNVRAGETDQYLVWDVELRDSAPAFNVFLNAEIATYLERLNERVRPIEDGSDMANEIFTHLFRGLHASRARAWLNESPEVDRFPPDDISNLKYQQMSIYRGLSFPYILPMAVTVRLGDVYLGIDKVGHLLGFGRRYHQRYVRLRDQGATHEEAQERTIRAGISQEASVVGMLVDGIFSHADLEANYQGFRLARDLYSGENPYIVNENGAWKLARAIDIRDYTTPDLDESYNPNHYWALRRKKVLPRLKELYGDRWSETAASQRFMVYRETEPSLSKNIVAEYFAAQGRDPQAKQSLAALCADD